MDKSCNYCGKTYQTKSKKTLYCSNACKQDAYRKRHGIEKPTFLTTNSPVREVKAIVENRVQTDKRYIEVVEALSVIETELQEQTKKRELILNQIAKYREPRSVISDISESAKLGSETILNITNNPNDRKAGFLFGALMGLVGASKSDYESINRKNRKKVEALQFKADNISRQINQLEVQKKFIDNGLIELRKEIKTQVIETTPQTKLIALEAEKRAITDFTAKAISLSELKEKEFEVYNFLGSGFENVIGNPAKNFKMLVYGEAGQGKSTWVIEFANYLAENHGKVLFNSSEEGISQSLKQKLNKYDSENLAISEAKTISSLRKTIRGMGYKFVVIDSINDMKIDYDKFLELTDLHRDIAFIFIMQATKGGAFKGSSSFIHEADIVIRLENYSPIVEKSRYR